MARVALGNLRVPRLASKERGTRRVRSGVDVRLVERLVLLLHLVLLLSAVGCGSGAVDEERGGNTPRASPSSPRTPGPTASEPTPTPDSGGSGPVAPHAEIDAWALGFLATDPEVVLGSTDGGRSWTKLATFEERVGFGALAFVDARIGWMVGGPTGLVKTEDGGRTWEERGAFGIEQLGLRAIHFPDARVGMVGGAAVVSGRGLDASTRPYIAVTSDGGASWDAAILPEKELARSEVTDGCLTSDGAGVAVGVRAFGGSTFTLRTEDFGRTWVDVSEGVPGSRVACAGEGQLWVFGGNSLETLIHRSLDGGGSWVEIGSSLPIPLSIDAAYFIDESRGALFGVDEDFAPHVFSTVDRGDTWLEDEVDLGSEIQAAMRAIELSSRGLGVAVGKSLQDDTPVAFFRDSAGTWRDGALPDDVKWLWDVATTR